MTPFRDDNETRYLYKYEADAEAETISDHDRVLTFNTETKANSLLMSRPERVRITSHNRTVTVKVRLICVAPIHETLRRSGISTRCQGISQFYLHTLRSIYLVWSHQVLNVDIQR